MKRFCVNPTRLAVGFVAVTGLGLANGGVATAVTTQTSSRSLASTLAALVAKHNIPMPVAGKQGTLVKVNPNGTLDPSATSPAHCHLGVDPLEGRGRQAVRLEVSLESVCCCDVAGVGLVVIRQGFWCLSRLLGASRGGWPGDKRFGRAGRSG